MAERKIDRWLAPKVILPVLLVLFLVMALLTPDPLRDETTRLTSYSVEARGARGLYQAADRLGWRVSRRETAFTDDIDRSATYAILATPMEPSTRELRFLLAAVREGASLLYVTQRNAAILDSLGLRRGGGTHSMVIPEAGIYGGINEGDPQCRRTILDQPVGLDLLARTLTLADSAPVMYDTVTFVAAATLTRREVVAIGMHVGRGRVLVVSEPDIFRNDVLRLCDRKEGVLAVRMLEWLAVTGGNELIFDEYHHGYGKREGIMTVVRRAMSGHPSGRVGLQLLAAALVLILAVGARPIPPRPRERIERRSPFEHVGALARAYEKVGATRRATRLFVRGLRRRHDAAAWKKGTDEEYLSALALSHRKLKADVDVLLDALREKRTPVDFIEVGKSVEHIERTLSSA